MRTDRDKWGFNSYEHPNRRVQGATLLEFSSSGLSKVLGFRVRLGLYGDNGKENGNYYNGFYRV